MEDSIFSGVGEGSQSLLSYGAASNWVKTDGESTIAPGFAPYM